MRPKVQTNVQKSVMLPNFGTICYAIFMDSLSIQQSEQIKTGKKITILLADDHPLYRQALRSNLEKHSDLRVIGEADDGRQAVDLTAKYTPDIVIMDISMPELNGLDATREIKQRFPLTSVLVLTVHEDSEHILEILNAGASGYLTKKVIGETVVSAIRSLMSGEFVLAAPVFQKILKHALRYSAKPSALEYGDKLTARELDILKLAAKGLSNKDIASALELSIRTVKAYMAELFTKLNVTSRTSAVIAGLRAGLIQSEDIE